MDSFNVRNPLAKQSLFWGPIIQYGEPLQSTYKRDTSTGAFTTFYPLRWSLETENATETLSWQRPLLSMFPLGANEMDFGSARSVK